MKTISQIIWISVFLLLITILCFSCLKKVIDDKAEIVGNLKSSKTIIEGKMIYLGNTNTRDFIDSCVVKDGKFKFSLKADKDFSPIPVNIVYPTFDTTHPYQIVGFKNPFLKKTFEQNFFIDRGTMLAEMDSTYVPRDNEIALLLKNVNKQTLAASRHLAFRSNPSKDKKITEYNISLVKKYSYSIDLLSALIWSKSSITNDELKQLLSIFDRSLQNNSVMKNLEQYVSYDNKSGTSFPLDIALQKSDSTFTSEVIDKKYKYSLVVFWASWCGPCRMEIPQIKSLYAKHKDKLNITSISVDQRNDWWKKAMIKEAMPWTLLLVPRDSSYTKLDKKYNLQTIPLWLLFDADNKLLDKEIGIREGKDAIDQKVSAHIGR
ncbi:MAG: TlpA disulfide reductase family protein [Dyadobacter sp.]